MSIRIIHIDGIDVLVGEYDDISIDTYSPEQRADIDNIASDKRRCERQLIYTLINQAAQSGIAPRHLAGAAIGHGDNGAPFLCSNDGSSSNIGISISHCRTGATIALCNSNLKFGIDIEDSNDKLLRVADKFINQDEKQFIGTDMLLCAWTVKEAVYKAAGITGLPLSQGINIIDITRVSRSGESQPIDIRSTIVADNIRYRGYTIAETDRCITLCRCVQTDKNDPKTREKE